MGSRVEPRWAPGNAHAKSREESRSLQKGQFSTHHALGFVVTLLFLGSVKTHDSSEKINTQQHFLAVRLEMPGTGSVRELIVSCPFCPCFYLFVLDPFAPLWICAFPLSFSFSSSLCHRCHLFEMPLAISIKLLIRTSCLETSPKQNNVAR